MAEVIITIKDVGNDGHINVAIEFDPPAEKGDDGTPAQLAAMDMLEKFQSAHGGEEIFDEDDEDEED